VDCRSDKDHGRDVRRILDVSVKSITDRNDAHGRPSTRIIQRAHARIVRNAINRATQPTRAASLQYVLGSLPLRVGTITRAHPTRHCRRVVKERYERRSNAKKSVGWCLSWAVFGCGLLRAALCLAGGVGLLLVAACVLVPCGFAGGCALSCGCAGAGAVLWPVLAVACGCLCCCVFAVLVRCWCWGCA